MADYVYQTRSLIIEQDKKVYFKAILIGLGVGILTAVLTYVIDRFILRTLVCAGGQVCQTASVYSGNIALIIAATASVAVMVKHEVYRPLLIALVAVILMWGFGGWLFGARFIANLVTITFLLTLSYAMLAWIVRLRSVPALVITLVVLVIIFRLIPFST